MGIDNVINERKIRDILKRDEAYFKPVKKKEICYTIDSDVSVIVSDTTGFVWDVPDEELSTRAEEDIKLEEKKKEEMEKSIEKIKKNLQSSSLLSNSSRLGQQASLEVCKGFTKCFP